MLLVHSSDIIAHRLALAEARVSENRLALIARHRSEMALSAAQQTREVSMEDLAPSPPTSRLDKRV